MNKNFTKTMNVAKREYNGDNLFDFLDEIFKKHNMVSTLDTDGKISRQRSKCLEDLKTFVGMWKFQTELDVIATELQLETLSGAVIIEDYQSPYEVPEEYRGKAIKEDKAHEDTWIFGFVKGAEKKDRWFKTFGEAYKKMLEYNSFWREKTKGQAVPKPPCFGINFEFGKGYSPRSGIKRNKHKGLNKFPPDYGGTVRRKHVCYVFDERYESTTFQEEEQEHQEVEQKEQQEEGQTLCFNHEDDGGHCKNVATWTCKGDCQTPYCDDCMTQHKSGICDECRPVEEEEEEEEEECNECVTWEYKGNVYLVDKNNIVYNYDLENPIKKGIRKYSKKKGRFIVVRPKEWE